MKTTENPEEATAYILPRPETDFEERGTGAQLAALYGALATARGQFGAITKDREVSIRMKGGGEYGFTYADLQSLLNATTPALAANGLAMLSPFTRGKPGTITQHVILAHKDGGRLVFVFRFPTPDDNDIKTLGGYQTYLTRYAYRSVLVLPGGEDLDEAPQVAVRGETGATARQAGTAAKPAPSQRPTPNPSGPPAPSKAEETRLNELKNALRACGYATKEDAAKRVTAALHGEFVQRMFEAGGLTVQQHDAVMGGLMQERMEQQRKAAEAP